MKRIIRDVACILLTVMLMGTFLAAAAEGFFTELADSPVFSFSDWGGNSNGGSESAAALPGGVSGAYSLGENTREELISRWNTIKTPYCGSVYSVTPSVVSPYGAGALRQEYLNDALNYLNFYRKVAKMPELTLSQAKCVNSQYGAVLLAANNNSSHDPPKPTRMTEDFYNKGYSAVSSSCIAKSVNYDNGIVMTDFINACFDDSSSPYYLEHLTHRRWFLSPDLDDIGFGQATATDGSIYTVAPVVADFNESIVYDYISWPSSGWFPSELITRSQSWNVCLNPDKYEIAGASSLTVKITRHSDGRVFNLTTADNIISTSTAFLSYDTINYAVPLNITFHIGSTNHLGDTLTGDFDIEINGVKDIMTGAAVTVSYTVKFFSLNDTIEPTTDDESETEDDTSESGSVTTSTTTTTTTTRPTTTTTTTAARRLRSVTVSEKPSKQSYYYKDSLNTSGLTLIASYSDGSTETVKSGFSCSPTYFNKTGTQNITVTYCGFSDTFNVTVKYSFFQYLIRIFLLGFLWY